MLECATLRKNKAAGNGGAISFAGTKLLAEGCAFRENHAENGGAVSVAVGADATFLGSDFVENAASMSGGAISNSGNLVVKRLRDCSFKCPDKRCSLARNNFAVKEGGFLYNTGTATAFLKRTKVIENVAADGGGVFNENGAVFTKEKTTIKDNIPNDIVP